MTLGGRPVTALADALAGGRSALIGYTGFVGANIDAQASFTDRFRSLDIDRMRGAQYDVIVCAGAPGVKWKANHDPATDQQAIQRLTDVLATVRAERAVLISTVDVYPEPRDVNEGTAIASDAGRPYGQHRLALERFFGARFDTLSIRLPGLFGPGLKKNVIFDFLHNNDVAQINPESVFQFYPLRRLWGDVGVAADAHLRLVNFATEPVSVADVASHAFGIHFMNPAAPAPVRYNVQTEHATVWGRSSPYLMSRLDVLADIADFVASQGWRRP